MTDYKWHLRGTCRKFGDDVPHDGAIMAFKFAKDRTSDLSLLIPNLFKEFDPGFADRVKPGDIILAGRNFGKGKAHFGGYIAMRGLGLGVLCESMPFLNFRAAISCGTLIATDCVGISQAADEGDDIEADFLTGSPRQPHARHAGGVRAGAGGPARDHRAGRDHRRDQAVVGDGRQGPASSRGRLAAPARRDRTTTAPVTFRGGNHDRQDVQNRA